MDRLWDFVLVKDLTLKKTHRLILQSYHDSQGITEAFKSHLLHRIKRELEADFDDDHLFHWPTYDPISGNVEATWFSKKQTWT